MHPFQEQKVQLLGDADYRFQVEFVRWMLDVTQYDSQIRANVLFLDEVYFKIEIVFNKCKLHM